MRRQPSSKKGGSDTPAKETDPLLEASAPSYLQSTQGSSTRSRRRTSRSPHLSRDPMDQSQEPVDGDFDSYQIVTDPSNRSNDTTTGGSSQGSQHYTPGSRSVHSVKRQQSPTESGSSDIDHPPLLEVPEHIYAVRKGALSVLKPLTKTWVRPMMFDYYFLRMMIAVSLTRAIAPFPSVSVGCFHWVCLDDFVCSGTMD